MIEYKTLKDKELYDLLIDYDLENPWKNFEHLKKLKYYEPQSLMSSPSAEYYIYFCAFYNNEVIGAIKLKVGGNTSWCHKGYKNWVSFISIREEFKGQKIARKLIQAMFKYAKENNLNILMSGYSEEGFLKVKHIFNEESINYNVELLDDRLKPEF